MKLKKEEYESARWRAEKSREYCDRKIIIESREYQSNQLQTFTHLDFYIVLEGMKGTENESREWHADHESLARAIEQHAEAILETAARISESKVEPAHQAALKEAHDNLAALEEPPRDDGGAG